MRSRILSIAEPSRGVLELSIFGVFDGRLLGTRGEEGEARVIWVAASGSGGTTFAVPDFDVLLILLVGFGAILVIFYDVHHIE